MCNCLLYNFIMYKYIIYYDWYIQWSSKWCKFFSYEIHLKVDKSQGSRQEYAI